MALEEASCTSEHSTIVLQRRLVALDHKSLGRCRDISNDGFQAATPIRQRLSVRAIEIHQQVEGTYDVQDLLPASVVLMAEVETFLAGQQQASERLADDSDVTCLAPGRGHQEASGLVFVDEHVDRHFPALLSGKG
ncbi:hypothetical protein ACGFIF_33130 [Kribbella sp. NPDC049174]|uniref:hypothetical protein n=1 Tax=Kribbella sp. NPDC049174 TaxID=3364112 RepID=UPI0037179B02